MAKTLEERACRMDTYEELVQEVKVVLHVSTAPGQHRYRAKAWWTKEVADAKRKKASRRHRQLNERDDTDAVVQAWKAYQVCKRRAAELVKVHIHSLNRRFMLDLKKAGQNAPKPSWGQIKAGTLRPLPGEPRKSPDDQPVEGPACVPLLEEWLRPSQRTEDISPRHDDDR